MLCVVFCCASSTFSDATRRRDAPAHRAGAEDETLAAYALTLVRENAIVKNKNVTRTTARRAETKIDSVYKCTDQA